MQRGKTLMDQLDAEENKLTRKRSKTNTRTQDQTLRKILRDHFAGFSDEEIDIRQIDDVTLLERLKRDRESKDAGQKISFGGPYYTKLRELYRAPTRAHSLLDVHDDTEARDEDLASALAHAMGPKQKVR